MYGGILANQAEQDKKHIALQKQVDAIDINLARKFSNDESQESSFVEKLKSMDNAQRVVRDKRGPVVLSFNSKEHPTIQNNDHIRRSRHPDDRRVANRRAQGIVAEARQNLKVRDLLTASPTTMQVVDFVKVSQPMTIGSPAPEASTKFENQLNFQSSERKGSFDRHVDSCHPPDHR